MPITINGTGTIAGISVGGLENGCVNEADLATAAVTNTKLASGAVTADKLASTVVGPAFSASANASTSLSADVWTKLLFGTEDYDTNNCFASSRFTPTIPGYYFFIASYATNSTSVQSFWIALYKNGAEFKAGPLWQTASGMGGVIQMTGIVYLNGSTDYCEAYARSSVSTSSSSNGNFTYFQGYLARPA